MKNAPEFRPQLIGMMRTERRNGIPVDSKKDHASAFADSTRFRETITALALIAGATGLRDGLGFQLDHPAIFFAISRSARRCFHVYAP